MTPRAGRPRHLIRFVAARGRPVAYFRCGPQGTIAPLRAIHAICESLPVFGSAIAYLPTIKSVSTVLPLWRVAYIATAAMMLASIARPMPLPPSGALLRKALSRIRTGRRAFWPTG